MEKSNFHAAGALLKDTDTYVTPYDANKHDKYVCPSCKHDVTVKQGKINAWHFAHKAMGNPCGFYEGSVESQAHVDAKIKLAAYLRGPNRPYLRLELNGKPGLCIGTYACQKPGFKTVRMPEGGKVITEFRQKNYKSYIPDVAILDAEGKLTCIVEIYHTHRSSDVRPEPWYELKSQDVLDFFENKSYQKNLHCIRERGTCLHCQKHGPFWAWFKKQRIPVYAIVARACGNGDLEILESLHSLSKENKIQLQDGRLVTLYWSKAMNAAASKGHGFVMEWLYCNRLCKITADDAAAVIGGNHVNAADWILNVKPKHIQYAVEKIPSESSVSDEMASLLDVIAHSWRSVVFMCGFSSIQESLDSAAAQGRKDVIAVLIRKGYIVTKLISSEWPICMQEWLEDYRHKLKSYRKQPTKNYFTQRLATVEPRKSLLQYKQSNK